VASACLGLAGAGRDDDRRVIEEWAARAGLADRIEVTTDVALLLAAGTPEGWGLALVAGTGSIAHGRTADGRTARAGGWGPLLGDEGSGYWLVMSALCAASRAADGRGPPTQLLGRLLGRLGLAEPQQLVRCLHRPEWDRPALAALAPVVFEAAEAGDGVASQLVEEGARELALAGAAVARQLGLGPGAVPLALAGGAFLAQLGYRERVLKGLADLGVEASPVALVPEPARGAVRQVSRGGPGAAAG
jgi:N-acetylglucosamine kinase-like BadF-type ATPase